MAAVDTSLFSLTKGISSANSNFFKKLKGKAITLAAEESRKMAEDIVQIITHREMLDGAGNGVYPMWDGSSNTRSKMSHKNWGVLPMGANHYAVRYSDPSAEDSYVGLLVDGLPFSKSDHVWHKSFYNILKKPRTKPFTSRLVAYNGRIFSSQMPRGLDPFLKVKKDQLQQSIEKRITNELTSN